jgi:hypothetical protein
MDCVPKRALLKVMIIAVRGLARIKILYLSGITDSGYIIGVAYIHNCMPKPIRLDKSLYFVVREEIIMPNPNPRNAINRIRKGTKNKL